MSQLSLRVLLFFKEKEVGGGEKKKAHWGYLLNKSCSTHKGFFGGQNWRTLLKDYVKSFLAVCASLCWLHILCSPHRVVMPTQLPLSQRNITVSYDRRARERKRGGGNFFKVKWKCNSCLPGITRETSNSEETNKFAKIWAKRHLFSSKVDKREDDRGGGVRGGVGGGVSFTTIHIHHALASFLTMKEVQNKQHKNKQTNKQRQTVFEPVDKRNLCDVDSRFFPL